MFINNKGGCHGRHIRSLPRTIPDKSEALAKCRRAAISGEKPEEQIPIPLKGMLQIYIDYPELAGFFHVVESSHKRDTHAAHAA